MRNKKFIAPGIYHKLTVKVVSQKWLTKFTKDATCTACYVHDDGEIYVSSEIPFNVRRHHFYHEISHHVSETLKEIESEEDSCDLLGRYLMDLVDNREVIDKGLEQKPDAK
jgi:hypothetical protein